MADTTNTQPNFTSLMLSGIQGTFKGALVGITFGLLAGAAFAAGIATLASVPVATAVLAGATIGGISFGTIGSFAGGMTNVIAKSREGQVSVHEATRAVKAAFAQGLQIGKGHLHEQEGPESTKWREYEQERATKAQQTSQKLH